MQNIENKIVKSGALTMKLSITLGLITENITLPLKN